MKTALVIGGAGFVGRHLIPVLTKARYDVTAIDPKFEDGGMFEFRSDVHCIDRKFSDEIKMSPPPDCIIHLGAHIQDISEREKGDIEKYQDIGLDLAVMRWVARNPPKQCFVWPSSCSVDSAETDPYAYSKTVGERMAMALHRQGIPTVILRPFSRSSGNPSGGIRC